MSVEIEYKEILEKLTNEKISLLERIYIRTEYLYKFYRHKGMSSKAELYAIALERLKERLYYGT